jgi:hypothetical protein
MRGPLNLGLGLFRRSRRILIPTKLGTELARIDQLVSDRLIFGPNRRDDLVALLRYRNALLVGPSGRLSHLVG